eukprot:jgi/Astpho2/6405/Aster-x0281
MQACCMQGTLAALDSRNPVLYINFSEGRLKFFGTIVFPKNKYMVLKFGNKDVLCEDVLENMIVFPEAWWVGTKEANPEEKQLPLPDSLVGKMRHEGISFDTQGPAGGDLHLHLCISGKRRARASTEPGAGEQESDAEAEVPFSQVQW